MQIDRIYYPILTLGYGKRIGIWTVGCPHACPGCSNPELWETNPGKEISISSIIRCIGQIQGDVDGVTISGGEPFEQSRELLELVDYIANYVSKDILIYSGYTIEELRQRSCPYTNGILERIAVLIDGKYVEDQNDNMPLRGSANQRIHVLNDAFRERYSALQGGRRRVQTVYYGNHLLAFGIPVKHYRRRFNKQLLERNITVRQYARE